MIDVLRSTAIRRAIGLLILFFIGLFTIPTKIYIEILNGLLTGMIFTMITMFWHLLRLTFQNREGYGRVEQITLGFTFAWITIAMGRANSVWYRASASPTPVDIVTDYFTCFVVATGIAAGLFTVTAPGWNDRYIHKRDRTTLYYSLIAGLLIALITFMLQRYHVLFPVRTYLEWLLT